MTSALILQRLCPVQVKVRPAHLNYQTSCTILYTISYTMPRYWYMILYTISVYDIVYRIPITNERYWCDIEDAPIWGSLATRYRIDIEENPSICILSYVGSILEFQAFWPIDIELFLRYPVLYCTAISGCKDIEGENFDGVHVLVWCRDIRIWKFLFSVEGFYRYSIRYAIPWASGRTCHVPAPPTGPASWSSTLLDGLYSCVIVFTPFPAPQHTALREMCFSAAFCCCSGPALVCRSIVGLPADGHCSPDFNLSLCQWSDNDPHGTSQVCFQLVIGSLLSLC